LGATFLTFLTISAVVIATPGPDTALTVRNALLGGRRAGIFTAAGIAVGQVAWSVATSLGLVALLLASEPIFQALKLAGAAYLVYLGVQSLRVALRRRTGPDADAGPATGPRLGGGKAWQQGLISNLSNPKMAVFFVSVLPQFAPAGQGMLSALLGLGVVFAVMTLLWLTLYAIAIARTGQFLRASRAGRAVERAIDGAAGLALIGLGVRVAVKER
jgi:threonine/homoserine/homoserine lactone efflux protein